MKMLRNKKEKKTKFKYKIQINSLLKLIKSMSLYLIMNKFKNLLRKRVKIIKNVQNKYRIRIPNKTLLKNSKHSILLPYL